MQQAPRHHRAAERPHAHAHGAVPAARAAPRAHRAPGRAGDRQAGRARRRRRARASSTARCSSACCRRSSTCCATPSCTASRRRPSARAARQARDRPHQVRLQREGAEVVIDVERRRRAASNVAGDPRARRGDRAARPEQRRSPTRRRCSSILEPGFSTAEHGHAARRPRRRHGRRRDRDQEARRRAAHRVDAGQGTTFTIRLPFTLAITPGADRARRTTSSSRCRCRRSKASRACRATKIRAHLGRGRSRRFDYGGQNYRFQHLGALRRQRRRRRCRSTDVAVPVDPGARRRAFDGARRPTSCVGSREIVVKSVGPQIAGDPRHLRRDDPRRRPHRHHPRHRRAGALRVARAAGSTRARAPRATTGASFALVVDDSITVRRVTQRLLERNGMRVMTAKDGVDAMSRAAGPRARRDPARHRDAAHGRLRGRRRTCATTRASRTCRSS